MDAGKKVLLDLFTGSLRFTVPVYQRRYSWSEAQCRQLWTDIVTAGRHPDRTHFTGSVVWIVFLQVGVHSMGTIFQQHRRLVSSRNRTVGTRRPFFLGYLVMRACSLRYEPPSNLTSLPWCTVRSINAAAMFLSPSTRPQPENSMFVV